MTVGEPLERSQTQVKGSAVKPEDNYLKLLVMGLASLISMYVLMYAMVNSLDNVFNNMNKFYMAGLMTVPMIVLELLLMGMMYRNKRLNAVIIALTVLAGLIFYIFIRQQTLISDKQFLRSMIPHHASAILMCQQAPVTDPEIKDLCKEIISSQQQEIDQMKSIMERLGK